MDLPTLLGWLALGIGAVGIAWGCVRFVLVTLPAHYGTNPGFGAFESSVMGWWLLACVGIGLLAGSARTAALAFPAGFVVLALLGMALGRVFGRRS